MSEQDIQRKIKKDLESRGCYVTKYNANGYGTAGHADLFVSIRPSVNLVPVAFYVEVKTKTGKLSLLQKIWHDEMTKNGHWVCVARSTEDVLSFLQQKGADKFLLHQ